MWIKDGELIEEKNDREIERIQDEREALMDRLFAEEGPECYRRAQIISAPFNKKISRLEKEQRMERPVVLEEEVDYKEDDVMSLDDWKACVVAGGFIDYDGYGRYVKDGKKTNIEIYPSDLKARCIREEFDTIVWYNR